MSFLCVHACAHRLLGAVVRCTQSPVLYSPWEIHRAVAATPACVLSGNVTAGMMTKDCFGSIAPCALPPRHLQPNLLSYRH